MFKKSLLSALLFASMLGCGGSSLDQTGATKATAAALTAQQRAQEQIQLGLAGQGSGVKVTLNGTSFTVDGTVTSPSGGTAAVSGKGTVSVGGSYSAQTSMTFANWKDPAQDLTLNGKLDISQSTSIGVGGANVEAKYTGDLVLTGSVTGTASFDLTVKTSSGVSGSCVTESGKVGGVTIDVKVGC